MDYDLIPNEKFYMKRQRRRQRKRWQKVVSILGCLVVFCTTYALILPAITQERETFCGMEAHSHGKACYTQAVQSELICSLSEEGGHVHADGCYVIEGGHAHGENCYALAAGHTHGESCYTLAGGHAHGSDCYSLTGGHTHDDGCYQWLDACQEAESETHTHTEACYQQLRNLVCALTEEPAMEVLACELEEKPAVQVLICEQVEGSEERELICTEGETPEEKNLICDLEEAQPHVHGEACYKTTEESTFACSLEEHEHALICYSDPHADVENAAVWERSFADVKLSGIWAKDVLALAESQLGYQESVRNYVVAGENETKGYTRYGDWYGDPYGNWCAMFVSFCLHYAEVEGMPLNSNCQNWIEALSEEELDRYRTVDTYDPTPGDLVFFDWTGDGRANHVGLVQSLTEEAGKRVLTTLEGNSSNRVKINTYDIDDDSILGYGMLPVHEVVRTADIYTDDTYTILSDDTTAITLTGQIPNDAEIRAFPVTVETEMDVLCAYDIAIFRADGSVYEPDASVRVHISSSALGAMEDSEMEMEVYYIPDEGSPEPMDTSVSEDGVTFDAPHFSTYAVMAVQSRATYVTVTNASALKSNLEAGKSVQLGANLSVSSQISIGGSGAVYLDLNGYTITCTNATNTSTSTSMFYIASGKSLTIQDSQATGETVTKTDLNPLGAHAASVDTSNGVKLTYYVTRSEITNAAVGATTETVYRHVVTGAGKIKAGTVPVFKVDGTLTVESGMIYGGAQRAILANNLDSKPVINLSGGYICGFVRTDSAKSKSSAAIYMNPGTLNISGTAVIAANQADTFGGAINVKSETGKNSDLATINMTGGVISGNVVSYTSVNTGDSGSTLDKAYRVGGGAIRLERSVLNLSGGYITNNNCQATGYWGGGGAVWMEDNSTLNMTGGYITGNEAGTGGGVKSKDYDSDGGDDEFYMTGGYICSNLARYAEGGGVAIGIDDEAYIYAGHINNNKADCKIDWGGGGIFVANGGRLYMTNVLVTDNEAGGFGGGVAGCSTARMHISANEGAAIYDNTAAGQNMSGNNSTKNEDWIYGYNSPVFMQNGYQDLFSALNCTIEGEMLGGGTAYWQGTCDGKPVSSNSPDDLIRSDYILGLTSSPTAQGIANAQAQALVFFNGNISYTHGGAILCNGYMEIGKPGEVVMGARIELTAGKIFRDMTMTDGQFTFVVTDEAGKIITTGTNDSAGVITFDGRLPLHEAKTYVYYIYEVAGEDATILYDSTRYRMTVVTNLVEASQAGSGSKVYQCKVSSLKVEKWNGQSWVQYIAAYDPPDSANAAIQLELGNNTFVNSLRETVSITVKKAWDCATGSIPQSIPVTLTQDGNVYSTVNLSASNNWMYTWTNLPIKSSGGNGVLYEYQVTETVPDGFTASYSYASTSSGTEVTITNTVQTYGLDITKIADDQAQTRLGGAVFHLLDARDNVLTFLRSSETGAYELSEAAGASADLTTDTNGKLILTGLPAGTYTLREMEAPKGYALAEDRVIILGANTEGLDQNGILAVTVVDKEAVYELPETGGIGSIPYTAGGLLLMTAAGLALLYNHKKRGKEDPASS